MRIRISRLASDVTFQWLLICLLVLVGLLLLNHPGMPDYEAYRVIITHKLPHVQPILLTGNWAWSGMFISREIILPVLRSYDMVRVFWISASVAGYYCALIYFSKLSSRSEWDLPKLLLAGFLMGLFCFEFYVCRLRGGICLLFILVSLISSLIAFNPRLDRSQKISTLLFSSSVGALAFLTHTATLLCAISFFFAPLLLSLRLGSNSLYKSYALIALYWFIFIKLISLGAATRGNFIFSDIDLRRLVLLCIIPVIIYAVDKITGDKRSVANYDTFSDRYLISYCILSGLVLLFNMAGVFLHSGEAITRFLSLSSFSSLFIIMYNGVNRKSTICVYLIAANSILFLKDFL